MDLYCLAVCKTNKGPRLYTTLYLIDKDGNIRGEKKKQKECLEKSLQRFSVSTEKYRSARLT